MTSVIDTSVPPLVPALPVPVSRSLVVVTMIDTGQPPMPTELAGREQGADGGQQGAVVALALGPGNRPDRILIRCLVDRRIHVLGIAHLGGCELRLLSFDSRA
jgi:hypothetical protein